jgi:hypothetical protein
MGRRGRPIFARAGCEPPFCWFAAAHDAYAYLGLPWTGRLVAAANGPIWVIVDWIAGHGEHHMVSRLRLHPDVAINKTSNSEILLSLNPRASALEPAKAAPAQQYRLTLLSTASLELERGWYCPNFGERGSIDVVAGRSQFRDRQWLAWILQPVDQNCGLEAGFRADDFEVRLPNGSVVIVPLRRDNQRTLAAAATPSNPNQREWQEKA